MAYVIASGTDEIQIINLNTGTILDFINTGAGSNPFWMAFLNERYCYATLMTYNSLAKIDVMAGSIVSEDSIGLSPEGIIIADFKAYIAVTAFDFIHYSYGQGKVAVYDLQGDSLQNEINVGTNPQYLARDMSGRIHVICTGDYFSSFGMIYVIDPGTDTIIDSFAIGGSPGQLTVGPDDIAYLAAGGWINNGYLYTYNAATFEVYHGAGNPIVVDSGCSMVVAYQDSTVFEGNFKDYIVSLDSSGTVHTSYAVGDGPLHIDFNYRAGDFNGDFMVNIADLTALVDWIFKGGAPPRYPFWRANTDGSYAYNVVDITRLADYLYRNGSPPEIGPTWIRP